MWTWIKLILLIIGGYLLGSLSVARIITKFKKSEVGEGKEDITESGSGNPGTMNMLRVHGAIMGAITLVADAIKAVIPSLIGYYLFSGGAGEPMSRYALYIGGFACVIGHIFPIFYNFKGGKGIACTFGTFLVADPLAAVILFVVYFVFFYFVKIGSLTSLLFITSFAIWQTFRPIMYTHWYLLMMLWLIVAIDFFAHRTNIVRLLNKTERYTSFKEGVEKDIVRIKNKKAKQADKLKDKNQALEEKMAKKTNKIIEKHTDDLEKQQEELDKIKAKREKKENKIAKKDEKYKEKLKNKEQKSNKKIDKYNDKLSQLKNEEVDIEVIDAYAVPKDQIDKKQ